MRLAGNLLTPIVLVAVLVLDLWTLIWSDLPRVENENDDEDDWEGSYIALSMYKALGCFVAPGGKTGGPLGTRIAMKYQVHAYGAESSCKGLA